MPKNIDLNLIDYEVSEALLIKEKLMDIMTPGYIGEFTPDEAEKAGAFLENALSESDAMNSSEDIAIREGE